MLSDDAKAVIALTTRLGSRSRPSLSPKRWHDLVANLADRGLRPADLFLSREEALQVVDQPVVPEVEELLGAAFPRQVSVVVPVLSARRVAEAS